jgi:hypothetical protein
MGGDRQEQSPTRAQLAPERLEDPEIIIQVFQDIEEAYEIKRGVEPTLKEIRLDQPATKSPTSQGQSFGKQIRSGDFRTRKQSLEFGEDETRAAAMLNDIPHGGGIRNQVGGCGDTPIP